MLNKLSNSQYFQDELDMFNLHIKDLPNEQKLLATKKINELKQLVEYIDTGHTQKVGSRITPSLMDNTRSQIVELRREIAKLCNIKI